MYKIQKKYDIAIDYHKKSLTILKKFKERDRIGVALLNVAESEMLAGQLDAAERHVAQAIQIIDSVKNKIVLTVCFRVQGVVAFKRGQLATAGQILQKAVQLSDSLDARGQAQFDAMIQVYMHLAQIANLQKNVSQERYYLQKAARWAMREEYPKYLREVYLSLSSFYMRTGENQLAATTLEQYRAIDDSLARKLNDDLGKMLQNATHYTQLEAEIHHMKQESAENQKLIKQQHYYILLSVIALIISLIFLIVMIILMKEREKLNFELKKNNKELEKLNLTKDKFFSIVAHDLKGPIKALQGTVHLVAIDALPPDAVKKIAATLDRDISSTLAFADNLILWARSQMENRQPDPKSILIQSVFDAVYEQLRGQSLQKQVLLQFNAPPEVALWCDPFQLEFVLRNLVSNALKFSWPDSTVCVKATAHNGIGRILVADTGVGIDSERLPMLFDIGTRSMPGTQGEKGTGLGLVLCKEFVEKNGGTISVESQPNAGTTFTVLLPLAPASNAAHG